MKRSVLRRLIIPILCLHVPTLIMPLFLVAGYFLFCYYFNVYVAKSDLLVPLFCW